MALHQHGILNPAEQKVAFFLSLSQAVRGEVAAHFAPARVFDQSVTFEDVLRYFRRINDQLFTHQMARRDFAACRQGDLSIDDWVNELRRLAGMCRFADPDERLLDAIVSGARSASLRERLAEFEFASSTKAYNFARWWERARRESSYKLDAPEDLKPRGILRVDAQPMQRTRSRQRERRSRSRSRVSADSQGVTRPARRVEPDEQEPVPRVLNTCLPWSAQRSRTLTRAAQKVLPGVSSARRCGGCEGDHSQADCPYKGAVCNRCGKTAGHISLCCPEKVKVPERGEASNPNTAAKATGKLLIHQVSDGCSPTTVGS